MALRMTPLLLLSLAISAVPARAADASPTTVPSTHPTGEIRRGVEMDLPPEERGRRAMERAARKIEPSLHGDPARLPMYLSFFTREFIQDLRIFPFDVSADVAADGTVRLTGYAEYPEQRETLVRFLGFLGFAKIDDRIQSLPAKSLGDKPFALVKVPHATLYDRTTKPRENVSQALLGDPLFLLLEADGYYLCHSADGYVGYVAADDVQRVTSAELSASQSFPRATITRTTTTSAGTLPAGAHLKVVRADDSAVILRVPGESDVSLPAVAVPVTDENAALARIAPVIRAARQFMGTKYVWGAKTLDGIDCSGLVQTSFQTQGLRLPRDADQQAYVGQLVATRWHRTDLRTGDTLYFLARNGHIHHTAIYVGNGEYIEAANPGVKLTSFNPAAPNYDKKRDESFCFAKRILD